MAATISCISCICACDSTPAAFPSLPSSLPAQGAAAAAVLSLLAFLASWAVLGFCAGLLLNVVDAVFVCFGMERDARMCTRPEVREEEGVQGEAELLV